MPRKFAVIAKCATTGAEHHYKSMKDAANKGGFEYTGVVNCVTGKQIVHAGFMFQRVDRATYAPPPRIVEAASLFNDDLTVKQVAERMGIQYKSASTLIVHGRKLGLINKHPKPQPWLMKTQNVENRTNAN